MKDKKHLKDKKTPKRKAKIFEIYTILIILSTLFMSVGFAQITDVELDVTGMLTAPIQEGVFISNISLANASGVNSNEVKYYKGTTLSTTVELSNTTDSYITYGVTLYNNSTSDYYFKGVAYDEYGYSNKNIEFSTEGLEEYITVIHAKETLEFNLQFKHKEGTTVTTAQTLNSLLNLEFSNEYIEITVAGTKYTVPKGATWEQYIASEYNTSGFKITDGKVYTAEGGKLFYKEENGTEYIQVKATDVISESVEYINEISLTIADIVFYAEPGMTISEWIVSDYVELPFTKSENASKNNIVVKYNSDEYYIVSSTGEEIAGTTVIKDKDSFRIKGPVSLSTQNNYVLELYDTEEGTASNYTIYGSSEGVGDKSLNLFDPNQEFVSMESYTGMDLTGSNKSYRLQVKLKEGKTIPAGIYLGYVYWKTESSSAQAHWLISNGVLNNSFVYKTNYAATTFDTRSVYKSAICFYCLTEENRASVMDALDIYLVESEYVETEIPDNEKYGKYRVPIEETGKNLVNIPDMNITFTNDYYKNYFPSNPKLLLKANTTYTLSFDYVFNSSTGYFYSVVGYGTNIFTNGIISFRAFGKPNQSQGHSTVTFTTPSQFASGVTPYLQLRLVAADSALSVNVDISNVQLEYGDKDTGYTPFKKNNVDIILDSQLMEGDHIDFKQGKVIRQNGTEENVDLPELLIYEDYTRIEVLTEVAPSRMEVECEGTISNLTYICLDKTKIEAEIDEGATATNTLSVLLTNAEGNLTWTSSNTNVAEISVNGKKATVTLKSGGTAEIIISDGKNSAKCEVNVTEKAKPISVGDTVKYDSNNDGTKEDWIVLTAEPGLVEIVSANAMGSLTLGSGDTSVSVTTDLDGDGTVGDDEDKAIASYNNAITTINSYCRSLVTATDNEGVRSVGASTDTAGDYSSENFNSWFKNSSTVKVKAGDEYYKTDFDKMTELEIANTDTEYWLASRCVNGYLSTVKFYVRYGAGYGGLTNSCLWWVNSSGNAVTDRRPP